MQTDSEEHRAIALALLAAGAKSADSALALAARKGDLEMARVALESGNVSAGDVRDAIETARGGDHTEVACYLEANAPDEPAEQAEAAVEVPMEALQKAVGQYKNDEVGLVAEIFLEGLIASLGDKVEDFRLARGQRILRLGRRGPVTESDQKRDGGEPSATTRWSAHAVFRGKSRAMADIAKSRDNASTMRGAMTVSKSRSLKGTEPIFVVKRPRCSNRWKASAACHD